MSKLEELLQGVDLEWLPLGACAVYEQPNKYLVKSKDYNNEYNTPVLTAGKTFILGYTNEKEGIYKASLAPVIIFDDFTTANKWVDFDFKAKSSAMKIIKSKDESKTLLRYIYYWINSLPSDLVEGDHKRQWISNFSKKLIPIPSIEIQQEIVRVLDELTSLTSQLKTELETERQNRKKQFEFFREQLFNFEEGEGECKTLGDIGNVKMCKRIFKNETKDFGDIPFYKIGTFGKTANAYISRELYEDYKEKYSYPNKGDILISAAGTIGRTVVFDGKPAYFQDSNIIWIENNQETIINEYLCHFYKVAKWYVSGGGTIDRLYNDNVRKTKIPVPFPNDKEKSLAEQKRIVKLLDQLDATHTAIEEEITKEIKLRTQQYEYYREKLLSFPSLRTK